MREFPEINDGAPLSVDIRPKTTPDQERLGKGLGKLQAEDPMLRVRTDQATGDVVIAGTGELHLEIILDSVVRGILSIPLDEFGLKGRRTLRNWITRSVRRVEDPRTPTKRLADSPGSPTSFRNRK